MLSFDLIDALHALTQSIWDLRRILSWVHEQEPLGVAVYGVSLGAYVASLLSGLVDGIDVVIAGIPVIDFPTLFETHAPHIIRLRGLEHQILGGTAEAVHSVVSPLAFTPRLPRKDGSSSPGSATGWPRRPRRTDSGSTWTSPRSAGTPATTWATCGPARCGSTSGAASRLRLRHVGLGLTAGRLNSSTRPRSLFAFVALTRSRSAAAARVSCERFAR